MEFYKEQQENLNRLIATLTPSQRIYYKARLGKLQRNIDVNRFASKLPKTAEGEKKVNTKRKDLIGDSIISVENVENLKNKIKKGDLTDLVSGHHSANIFNTVQKSIKPNISSISADTAEKAILTRASTVFKRQGKLGAQRYLETQGIKGYEILPESNDEGIVIRNTKTGKIKIAFRGTIIPEELSEVNTSVGDIGTDLSVMTGFEDETPQFQRAKEQIENVRAKYGSIIDELLGYSLGGSKANILGDRFGIDTTTFNPLIGKNFTSTGETSAQHTIFRTTEDIPSIGSGIINRDNVDVQSILPLKSSIFNIKSHHDLKNFIIRGRPRHSESHINKLTQESLEGGVKAGEMKTMIDMSNYIDSIEDERPPMPRFGQQRTAEQRAKFANFKEPSFTDFIHKFNGGKGNGIDTNSSGELLPTTRITNKSTWGKLWEKAGGEYTPEEQAIFDKSKISESEPILSKEIMNKIINSDEQQRAKIFDKHVENLFETHAQLEEATNATDILPMRNGGSQPVGFGASTAIGLLSGLAGEGIVRLGEKTTGEKVSDKMDQRTALTGGIGGYLGAAAIARAGGTVASNPELLAFAGVGALSSVVGKETGEAVDKAGGTKFEAAEASGTSAGAVGGLGAALVAGSTFGATVGIPLDLETLGMASVVGATIGASISGIGYGLSKLGISF